MPIAAPEVLTSDSNEHHASKLQAPDSSGTNIKDVVIENFRPMSVIVIGAGFSGIYLGIRIPERLRNVKLTIYEKNAGPGGTWYENRYPGCACDIPGMFMVRGPTSIAEEFHSTFIPIYFCSKSELE
jgi:hypothetical protein